MLTFDCNILFLLHGRFCFFLGNQHLQGAVLKFSLDVLPGHCVTYIEASAAGTKSSNKFSPKILGINICHLSFI